MRTPTYNFDNLKYYAIEWSFNEDKPEYINIMEYLDSVAFSEAVEKYNTISNYEELYRWLSRELKYLFTSKAEHEMDIKGLFSDNRYTIDVWEQIAPNMRTIVDMVNAGFGLNYPQPNVLKNEKCATIIKIRGE